MRPILCWMAYIFWKGCYIDLPADRTSFHFSLILGHDQANPGQVEFLPLFNSIRLNSAQVGLAVPTFQNTLHFDMIRLLDWLQTMASMAFLSTTGFAALHPPTLGRWLV